VSFIFARLHISAIAIPQKQFCKSQSPCLAHRLLKFWRKANTCRNGN